MSDGRFRALEAPFFVRNVAVDDVVRAESEEGVLWAGEWVSWGGHQTIRVTPRKEVAAITCQQVLRCGPSRTCSSEVYASSSGGTWMRASRLPGWPASAPLSGAPRPRQPARG